jgi:phage gp29-like protein
MTGADFWDYGWFVHRHKAKSGYIARSGLHRVLSWSFLFKNYGIRDVMEFLETYGLPSKIGKYPSGATEKEKLTLLRAVMSIGRNAGGIIPHGMAIDFEQATDGDTKIILISLNGVNTNNQK